MTAVGAAAPSFWRTVWLLLVAARKRAKNRYRQYQKLRARRTGKPASRLAGIGFPLAILWMAVINGLAAFVVGAVVTAGERVEAEAQGSIVVDQWFLDDLRIVSDPATYNADQRRRYDWSYSRSEAARIADAFGGNQAAIRSRLYRGALSGTLERFVSLREAAPGVTGLTRDTGLAGMLGSLALLWWGLMLVCQGEGLELDTQRRRHPMWEWLFSHPVSPAAVFLGEMLAPIAANPIYASAPLFLGVLYGQIYGAAAGIAAAFLVGIPVSVAAACLGKALEIGIMLRFPPRTRGAAVGLMGWFGFTSMMLFMFGLVIAKKLVTAVGPYLDAVSWLPWPWLGWVLGLHGGSFSFADGVAFCLIFSTIVIAASVAFSVWGARQGLVSAGGRNRPVASTTSQSAGRFGKDPLYRKELLWFARDRSAIVQVVLVPLTMASLQLFNLRGLLAEAQSAWNYICGAAILFGTYFLIVLGPKSLMSEGTALWIALTWPRGLEELLKAKARLWALISSAIVGMILCYAAFLYPGNAWKVALVGVGWLIFGRSMAEKMVTLASVTSESGEVQRVPSGRRYATMLGALTFSVGVLTQQPAIAIMGIVYSVMTAAAMWQNFRARLPYLYDVWSEVLPPAPTLMHAMIAISGLAEGATVFALVGTGFLGSGQAGPARAVGYGIAAVIVSLLVTRFLSGRNVSQSSIWYWPNPQQWTATRSEGAGFLLSIVIGAAGGLVLGLLAHFYQMLLLNFGIGEIQAESSANLRFSLFIMGVVFAPAAEEYLFRGLLYRTLDRDWGGWRAVLGAAAFFAIYHPPMAWLPVGLVGAVNALLFKKTGRLAPAVVLHMIYNAVVLN